MSEQTFHQPTADHPKRDRPIGKSGAPKGNLNAMTHGVLAWLRVGGLPAHCSHIKRALSRFQAHLEDEVIAAHGTIGTVHAALIQSCGRHEARAALLQRWLRIEQDLSLADRLAVLREIGNATDARDACLKRLEIGKPTVDPWTIIDAKPNDAPQHPSPTAKRTE